MSSSEQKLYHNHLLFNCNFELLIKLTCHVGTYHARCIIKYNFLTLDIIHIISFHFVSLLL